MKKKILFVAVHPDDETLAFGGTILKHKQNGDEIYWLIVTNVTEVDGWSKHIVERRQCEIETVSNMYGFNKTIKLDFPTTKLDSISESEMIDKFSQVIKEIEPNIIYLPNRSDVHSDHQKTFKTVYSCTKNFRYPFIERILMGETLSETEFAPSIVDCAFIPNVFVDITEFFPQKCNIMQVYDSEIMEDNLPRSLSTIEALSRFRGSSIGVKYAESFMLLKEKL